MICCSRCSRSLYLHNLLLLHLLHVEVGDKTGGGGGGGRRGMAGVHMIFYRYRKSHAQLLQQFPAEPRLQGLLRWVNKPGMWEVRGQRSGPDMKVD